MAVAMLAVAMVALLSGCRLSNRLTESAWPLDKATQPQTPASVAAIWSDTVMYTAGKPPTRGFGGRLYFYDARRDAIKVDGQLVVYVYDDDNPNPGDKPAKRYIFSPEELSNHHAGSELGPSYNVWIPWDVVGGPTKQLSLVPFFLPTEGGMIAGEHTRHRLPGTEQQVENAQPENSGPNSHGLAGAQRAPQGVQQVAFHEEAQRAKAPSAGMRTTTITVPSITRDRLAHSQSIPRDERTYVAEHRDDASAGWDHYDRAQFSAQRAAEYRSERFTRQRLAPWEAREALQSPANHQATEARQESAVQSASDWAQQYRQRHQSSWAKPAQANSHPQPPTDYSPTTRPVPTTTVGQSGPSRANWQPGHAGWRSDLSTQSTTAP